MAPKPIYLRCIKKTILYARNNDKFNRWFLVELDFIYTLWHSNTIIYHFDLALTHRLLFKIIFFCLISNLFIILTNSYITAIDHQITTLNNYWKFLQSKIEKVDTPMHIIFKISSLPIHLYTHIYLICSFITISAILLQQSYYFFHLRHFNFNFIFSRFIFFVYFYLNNILSF